MEMVHLLTSHVETEILGAKGKTLGILDDDRDALECFRRVYESLGLVVKPYFYPKEVMRFMQDAKHFDYVLLDQHLGGTNGANIASLLIKDMNVTADIFVFSGLIKEEYRDFEHYWEKTTLVEDPNAIFRVKKDRITQAVETSALMLLGT